MPLVIKKNPLSDLYFLFLFIALLIYCLLLCICLRHQGGALFSRFYSLLFHLLFLNCFHIILFALSFTLVLESRALPRLVFGICCFFPLSFLLLANDHRIIYTIPYSLLGQYVISLCCCTCLLALFILHVLFSCLCLSLYLHYISVLVFMIGLFKLTHASLLLDQLLQPQN